MALGFLNNVGDDPVLGPALAYWVHKRGLRSAPARRDIDALEIPALLLPYLQITEQTEGNGRIRFRLVGTGIVDAYGADPTGKYMDDIYSGERLHRVEANYRAVCTSHQPVLVINHYLSKPPGSRVCHRLIMPLADDGVTIRQFLTAIRFEYSGDAVKWRGTWLSSGGNFDDVSSFSRVIGTFRPRASAHGFD